MTAFSIEVYADTACPWSYVGKVYLDRAMEKWRAEHPDDVFKVVWRPFYLNIQAKRGSCTSGRPFSLCHTIAAFNIAG